MQCILPSGSDGASAFARELGVANAGRSIVNRVGLPLAATSANDYIDCIYTDETHLQCVQGYGDTMVCLKFQARPGLTDPTSAPVGGRPVSSINVILCYLGSGGSPIGEMSFDSPDGSFANGTDFEFTNYGGCFGSGCGHGGGEDCYDDIRVGGIVVVASVCAPCDSGYHHYNGVCVNDQGTVGLPQSEDEAALCPTSNPKCLMSLSGAERQKVDSAIARIRTNDPTCKESHDALATAKIFKGNPLIPDDADHTHDAATSAVRHIVHVDSDYLSAHGVSDLADLLAHEGWHVSGRPNHPENSPPYSAPYSYASSCVL